MKILIVDDDILVCQSLKVLISREDDMQVIALANNGQEAIDACHKELPDIILMDIQMPILNGIQATRIIKKQWPEVHVMILTTFLDKKNIRLAIQAGAKGYLIKSSKVSFITGQIRALVTGISILDKDVIDELTNVKQSKVNILTSREKDIVSLVSLGMSNKEIAQELFLTEGTVRNNLSVILEKLELRDRTQLAIYYLEHSN